MGRVSRVLAVVGGVCGLLVLGGFALQAALATAAVRHSVRIGPAPVRPAGSKVLGSLANSTRLGVTVTLEPRNPRALAAYATAVSTRGSSVYHQYLSVSQFAARFGPTPAQVSAVKSALRGQGLDPGRVSRNDLSLSVDATAGKFAHAFSTKFERVALRGGRRAFANTRAPLLPAGVARYVQGVIGLSDLVAAQPQGLPKPVRLHPQATAHIKSQPQIGSGPQPCGTISGAATTGDGYHTEDQIATAYGFDSMYPGDEGAGETIAVYELEPYSATDIAAFQSCYGTSATVNLTDVDGGPGSTGSGEGEAALDIEDVIGLAPEATIDVYDGPNGSGNYDTYSAIVTADTAQVITTSWGLCEAPENSDPGYISSENTLFEEAAAQGQSIFAASGDQGSEACNNSNLGSYDTTALAVQDPSSQPFVTGVGGTALTDIGAPPTTPPTESVWNQFTASNQHTNAATTGGVSSLWTMPTYQSSAPASLKVINTNSSGTPCGAAAGSYCREVPDVAADASSATGYIIYWNSNWFVFGGTSAAAPTWAAYMTLVDDSSACKGVPIGFANPSLYSVAGSAWTGTTYSADFNDITVGNNNPLNYENPGMEGLYSAAVGYDMTTGLGSQDGAQLASALCGAVTPIGTVALPDSKSLPTAVVVDTTNHIAYIGESADNAVAEIANSNNRFFTAAATNISTTALPSLDFPDSLALDASHDLYASDFCVGSQASVCSSEAPGTTTSVSQQTGTSSGQTDTITGCKYPSGDAVTGSALFVACAGSGVVAGCATTSTCATGATTVALNKPAGGVTPVPSGVAGVGFAPVPTVIVADARNSTLSLVTDTAGILSAGTPVKLASGCVPATVAVGPTTSNTADVYVACPGNGTIEVGTVSGTPPSLGTFTATALPTTGTHTPSPYGIAVNAAGTDLVVTDSANNDAVVYPSLSGATLGTGNVVAVGTEPDGVGMDGGNAFIANEGSGNVSVVDPIDAGKNTGHYVSAHARGATLRPSLLTPLIAPVPAGSIR